MDVPSFEPRLDRTAAVRRTDRLTLGTYLLATVRSLLGSDADPVAVTRLYYPNYLAYTTVDLHRIARGERTVKFVAAIDAITGRAGEVDVDLPDRETIGVGEVQVLPVEVDRETAHERWRDWLFPYLDRKYRPVRRPDRSLDRLELVYTPYWIVDYGPDGTQYAVSGLTKQVELIEDIEPLAERYGALD